MARFYKRSLIGCLGMALLLASSACSVGPDRRTIRSIRATEGLDGGRLEARPNLVAYRTEASTHAEILATDLTIDQLDPAVGFEGIRGQITRIRMFTRPVAGKTPLSNAAGNSIVQHVVINDGALAVYGGAGLLRPRGRPGEPVLDAVLRNGTVRLTRSTPGLVDPIGTARLDLAMSAALNAPLSRLIAARLDQIIETTQPRLETDDARAEADAREDAP